MVWCGVVWCGVVWCGVVWCGVVWCGVVWCGVVWCGVVWCGVVRCAAVRCGAVQCEIRGENFAFRIGDESFPMGFFAQFDSWLTVTVTGCLACPISGSL